MKVLGIVGSMRKDRHTDRLVNRVIGDMKAIERDVMADVIYIADITVHPCRVVCSSYCSRHAYQCSIADGATDILVQMAEADVRSPIPTGHETPAAEIPLYRSARAGTSGKPPAVDDAVAPRRGLGKPGRHHAAHRHRRWITERARVRASR